MGRLGSRARSKRRGRARALWNRPGVVLGGGLLLLAVLVVLVRARGRGSGPGPEAAPEVGEAVPIEPGKHIPEGVPPTYASEPPSSGEHYPSSLQPGFYDEDARQQMLFPEGYLTHNLEHGYILFWYDCSQLDAAACERLKADLQAFLQARPERKLIAFPAAGLEAPLVLTSWGRRLALTEADSAVLEAFVVANYNRAPEPNAP